jgi:PTS system mannose-specific IID component
MNQPLKVTRGQLLRSWLNWLVFSHACYNYERMQGLGVAHAMAPIIRALYHKKEDVSAALKRHLVFFNTEPQAGAVIHGAVIAMEEERANGADISDEAINSVKCGLMGPLSGLGDSITQGLITPILLALGIGLASEGNLAGPILYFVLESAAIIGMSYVLWMQGYRWGRAAVEKLLAGGLMQTLTEAASVLGLMVVGGLAARQVSLSTVASVVVGKQTVALQVDVLDKIMKGLLPLALTLIVWWLLSQRRSPLAIIGVIFSLGMDGVLLDWLGWAPTTVSAWSLGALVLTLAIWWLLLLPKERAKPYWTLALLLLNAVLLVLWGRLGVSVIVGMVVWAWRMWKK